MANEFVHGTVGVSMTQAEFEAVGLHVLNSQAIGDLIYASSTTQLSRLGIGATNAILTVIGGVPTWQTTLSGLTFVAPTLGVASATSLATSAAIPLLLTQGQLVNISLTSQTVGATTLTIPDFASVIDEFTFKTKAQTMSNKTFVAPVLGAATATSINGLIITTTAGTLTIANNASAALVTSGNYSITLTATAATNVTLPTTGTLATLAGAETFTAKLGYNGLVVTPNTGAITTGTWTATVVSPVYGGTGIANNVASTITITGAYSLGLTLSAATALTLPTTGTLATLAGTEELDNKTLDSSVLKGTFTASGTVTLPAITLGGTVAGGSQTINSLGDVGIGVVASSWIRLDVAETFAMDSSSTYFAIQGVVTGTRITSDYTGSVRGYNLNAIVGAANTQNWTDAQALRGFSSLLVVNAGATGTITGAVEFYGLASVGAMTITNLYGVYLANATGAGAVTNQYGIYFESLTKGATLNYMIHGAADITFGMGINIATGKTYQIAGTQVIGARVVDARCDDVINSGDATTDGVIDALRDAMITHGLIAAA